MSPTAGSWREPAGHRGGADGESQRLLSLTEADQAFERLSLSCSPGRFRRCIDDSCEEPMLPRSADSSHRDGSRRRADGKPS
jgi:hypothetical protein